MNNRKLKIVIFILLIISLIIIIFYSIFGTSLSYLSVKEIKKDRKLKENLITSFTINNIDTVYDKINNIYYYNISEDYEKNNYVLKLNLDSGYKYKIKNQTLNVINVDYTKPINIIIYNDKYYYETKIQLTNLPIISINTEDGIGTEDMKSTFKYINTSEINKIVTSNSMIHIRGASSSVLSKKSYRIDMYDKKYIDDKNIQISNFYNGDSFILDANYRDNSKIRNVLSVKLWNEISKDFTNVDLYTEFVELFINNEYQGLYVFCEPVNRKNLNLPKTGNEDTSGVIKMVGWSKIDMDMPFEDITEESYMNLEIKYPNQKMWYPDTWKKLISTINKYYDKDIKKTDKLISNTFNLKNYIDLIIFNAFTNNVDNCMKYNNYYYFNSLSDEIFIQPWDMEFSYGYYSLKEKLPELEYDKIACDFYHEDAKKTNKLLIERYWNLRKNILSKEYIDKLISDMENELSRGVIIRDSKTWKEYDWEKEVKTLRTWIYKRLEFFDDYVESLENE